MEETFEFENIEDIISQKKEMEVINACDFDVITNENLKLQLIDLQGGNLANIEEEEFQNLTEILNRLESSYLHDYNFVERCW